MYAVTRLDNYRSLKPVGLVRHAVFTISVSYHVRIRSVCVQLESTSSKLESFTFSIGQVHPGNNMHTLKMQIRNTYSHLLNSCKFELLTTNPSCHFAVGALFICHSLSCSTFWSLNMSVKGMCKVNCNLVLSRVKILEKHELM